MRRVLSLIFYSITFLIGRGALFVAPLILSNLLPTVHYAWFEWAQATGSLGSVWLVLGTGAVIPLVMLVGEAEASLLGIYAFHLIVTAGCLLWLVGLWFLGLDPKLILATLFTVTLLLQNLWSAQWRTDGRSEASILLQSGLMALAGVAAIVGAVVFHQPAFPWVVVVCIGYTGVLGFMTAQRMWRLKAVGERFLLVGTLKAGLPLMLSSVITVLATTSGRFGIGLLSGPQDIAEYSVLARGAAVPIVAHQLIIVAKFRDLFLLEAKALERMLIQILVLVSLSVVGFWLVCPRLGWMLGRAFHHAYQSHRLAAMWILTQSILWSAIALNDLVCSRHKIMWKVLPWTISAILLGVIVGLIALKYWGVTIGHFVFVHATVMLFFYLAQGIAMSRAGVRQPKVWSFAVAASVVLAVAAFKFN